MDRNGERIHAGADLDMLRTEATERAGELADGTYASYATATRGPG
jgi:hypothetical protein